MQLDVLETICESCPLPSNLLHCQDSFCRLGSLRLESVKSIQAVLTIVASCRCSKEVDDNTNHDPWRSSLRLLTCLRNMLQDVGALKDALHQTEERLKGLQAAFEQEKGKAEVRPPCCSGMRILQCHLLRSGCTRCLTARVFGGQASGSELAALKQRALAAEQEAAALQQGQLEAEAASAAARKAQKVGAVHVPSCSSFRIEQHL